MLEEKEIEDFKPSTWLYIFLFTYYSIWVLQGFGALMHYWTFGFDSFEQYGLVEWLFFHIYLVAAFYSLYAVIKTLRGDSDCITALKWSLVVIFLYTGYDHTRGQIATYNIWVYCIVLFARPLFYLIFYLYLTFAKGIKRRYPKEERSFGPSGWVWVSILTTFVILLTHVGYQQYRISKYCKKVDVESLNLLSDQVSDGFIIFDSDRKWEKMTEPTDTLWIEDRIETLPSLMSKDSVSNIYLFTGRCDKHDARTHNQIIVSSIGLLETLECKGALSEISFTDSVINGNKLMTTVFELTQDSIPVYFTVANITDSLSPKCAVFVRVDKGVYYRSWILEVAKSIRFDLQNITEGKNNEEGNNTQNGKTYRIGDSYNQADANMFATLQQSLFPRLLVSVMHTKNRERKIAKGKCQNVVYNL